jgi:hypothetical protein
MLLRIPLGCLKPLMCMFVAVGALSACPRGAFAQRVYNLSEVTRIPVAMQAPGLSLPNGFDLAAVRDTVIITYVVDTTGRVDPASITIVRPGDPTVRRALIAAVRQEVYSAGRVAAAAVPVRLKRQLPMPLPPPVARAPIASIRARVRALVGPGPFRVPPLRHRYQRREYCEGDYCGCDYGVWEATTTIPVFPAEFDTLGPAFVLGRGERFDAMRGYHHVLRPSVVIVLDTVPEHYHGHRLVPGDTLYLREYTGEITYDAWYRDSVINVHVFWAPEDNEPKGALVQAGTQEWWVPIRTAAGRGGWIRVRDPAQIQGPNPWCVPTADSTIW